MEKRIWDVAQEYGGVRTTLDDNSKYLKALKLRQKFIGFMEREGQKEGKLELTI